MGARNAPRWWIVNDRETCNKISLTIKLLKRGREPHAARGVAWRGSESDSWLAESRRLSIGLGSRSWPWGSLLAGNARGRIFGGSRMRGNLGGSVAGNRGGRIETAVVNGAGFPTTVKSRREWERTKWKRNEDGSVKERWRCWWRYRQRDRGWLLQRVATEREFTLWCCYAADGDSENEVDTRGEDSPSDV